MKLPQWRWSKMTTYERSLHVIAATIIIVALLTGYDLRAAVPMIIVIWFVQLVLGNNGSE